MTEKEEKRTLAPPDERRYAIITKETIRLIAEAAGHTDITDEAAAVLGEDVSYRLRESTHYSTLYMKHAKRKKLTTEDFNKALKQSDVQPIHGYNFPEPLTFRPTNPPDIYFLDEAEVSLSSLALNEYVPQNPGETSIKSHWLAVEGVSKSTSSSQPPLPQQAMGTAKPYRRDLNGVLHKPEYATRVKSVKQEITEPLQKYYDIITNVTLGSDTEALKMGMRDLSTNAQIVPLVPHLVTFICTEVRASSYDVSQMTKVLHMVKALVSNPYLYLEPHSCLSQLVQGVTYCLLEPLAASINPRNDHWVLRDYAAFLLAQILNIWSSPINHIMMNTVRSMKEVLYDHTKPFCCHYGAVMGLLNLGSKTLEDILITHLPHYWPHLMAAIEDTSYSNMATKADAHKVYGAMLQSVEFLLLEEIKKNKKLVDEINPALPVEKVEKVDDQSNTVKVEESITVKGIKKEPMEVTAGSSSNKDLPKSFATFYNDMYEYFGDSLAMKLPLLSEICDVKGKVFLPKKDDKLVSLSDPEAMKSGEELWEEFMEQVKIQQKLDRERMERERMQRQIDYEKRERERRLQEEHHRLMEAGKKRLEEIRQAEIAREKEEMERLEHEQRRNKKIAEQRISKMLQSDDEDDFEDEFVPYHKPKRFRQRSMVQYSELPEDADVEMRSDISDEEQGSSASAASNVDLAVKPGQGIKLKIITRPGKHHPNIKVKTLEPTHKEAKKTSHHPHKTKSSPHNVEAKHSPHHQREAKSSPHLYKESKSSPLAYRESKDSPHQRESKSSPHIYRESKDSPHYRESKHSPHSHSAYKEAKSSPHSHRDVKDPKHSKRKKSGQKSDRKDEFEFESDPEDVPPFSFKSHHYSSEGESSDGTGQRKPLTLKLKVKDSREISPD
ncbi:hypothetical protein FSP39_010728 [Pinctada imbricata]|uniref:Histone H4 n=1 Tax=Pinctada imbricata TaxID=66713 RepID=A0AA89BZ62_PINIB|nr:hypothetical protein FSP39_010728 [Pinctada imbricata]